MSLTPPTLNATPANATPARANVPNRPTPVSSERVVPARPDGIERSSTADRAGSRSHGFGIGLMSGAAAEGGIVGGAGASASAGAGLFFEPGTGVKPGAFASAGAFLGKAALGAFAGVGAGAFVTNAGSVSRLAGVAQTSSLNVGVGPLKVSLGLGVADGTYAASLSIGPGIGLDLSTYPTHTATTK